ncbi:MAG: Swt1 family HEPN domain-containing protein [Candidatus Binataceae bacterium]
MPPGPPSIHSTLYSLRRVLRKFVEAEMRQCYGQQWLAKVSETVAIPEKDLILTPEERLLRAIFEPNRNNLPDLDDCLLLLRTIKGSWREVFASHFDNVDEAALTILLAVGGKWARQQNLTENEMYLVAACAARLVFSILKGEEPQSVPPEENWRAPPPGLPSVGGKYRPLYDYLSRQTDDITLTFDEIEEILGEQLPPSAANYQAWWANEDPYGTMMVQKRAWLLAGFKAYPKLQLRMVQFVKR